VGRIEYIERLTIAEVGKRDDEGVLVTGGLAILGVPIDNVSMQETLQRIEEFISEGSFHQIATANVDYLVNAIKDPDYRHTLCMCDLVVADGMPIVWASRLLGSPLRERVTGADLVPNLARLSGIRNFGIFLLGASPEVSKVAASRLEELGGQIVGRLAPPVLPLEEFDNEAILAEIENADPDILLVAFGSPKQEKWIHQNASRLQVPVCIGIGGSLDFVAGAVSRAPRWMQRASLEWIYRMGAEPRRLARRYFKDALWMARYLTVQLAMNMPSRQAGRALQVAIQKIGSVGILSLSGMMTGSKLAQLETAALSLAAWGGPLIVELAGVSYLGADGLRTLAGLLREASSSGCQLWLAGVPRAVARTLRVSCCDGLFRTAPSVLDAVREASRGRLQLNLELGEGWAVCRIGGEIPQTVRSTLEGICRQVLDSNEIFEFDASGVPEFDPSDLLRPSLSNCRLVFAETSRSSVAGVA
jgi:N-acetylglucosaminyldiphosphoundecaprenol N-acetyl-beta-D-mannosaminyltransferase